MTVMDMLRVCTLSSAAIVAGMLLLGAMMIAQKPEARLVLAEAPIVAVPPMVPAARPAGDAVQMTAAELTDASL